MVILLIFLIERSCLSIYNYIQWIFQVPVKGGRDYLTPYKAIYKWYLCYRSHLLGEPETTIDIYHLGLLKFLDPDFFRRFQQGSVVSKSILGGQIIATSHDLTPNGGLVREITLFQGSLGW